MQLIQNTRLSNPGEIVDIEIDTRVARDFGGANVVKNLKDFGLSIEDPEKTIFHISTAIQPVQIRNMLLTSIFAAFCKGKRDKGV